MNFEPHDYSIQSAGQRGLYDGAPVPQMGQTIRGYFRPLQLIKVISTIVNQKVEREEIEVNTRGTVQPLSTRELLMKPEGERAWEWIRLYVTADLILKDGEVVRIQKRSGPMKFRVMGSKNWEDSGFMAYDLVNDYNS